MKVKIWLNRFILLDTNRIFKLTDVSNVENQTFTPVDNYSFSIEHIASHNYCDIEGEGIDIHKSGTQIPTLSTTSTYIIIEGTFDKQHIEDLYYLIKGNIIELLENDEVLLFCYKLNCEHNRVDKTSHITYVKSISGVFNHSIGVKKLSIDLEGFISNQFNYVYIVNLDRYYFVDSVEIISNDITRLHLSEDVLNTWSNLIGDQNAFISRYENSDQINMVDDRLPMENVKTIELLTDIDYEGDLVNINFDFNVANNKPVIAITSQSTEVFTGHGKNDAPTGTNLPEIRSTLNDQEYLRFIDFGHLYEFCHAYRSDDATSSFIESVIYFPFDCESVFNLSYTNGAIYVKDKFIDSSGDYAPVLSGYTPLLCYYMPLAKDGASPYLIIADFTYEVDEDTFDQHEPYSNYEIYIPFVSWVSIQFKQFVNQHIIVYYAIDFKTGISTAYVYNVDHDYVIWSGTCQLGIKLDMTTTNQIENTKQKQASDLNMILSGIGGMIAMGVGAYTGNPVAFSGGVLSVGKAIASNVNTHNMIFERAQTSIGTSENALYSPNKVVIRKTYNKKIVLDSEDTYNALNGKPYNNYVESIGNYTGYIEIPEIHFDPKNSLIYTEEIDEIVSLLKSGVIM